MKTNEAEKMDLRSLDIAAEKRSELKHALGEAFPEVFAEGLIDFEQLKLLLSFRRGSRSTRPSGHTIPTGPSSRTIMRRCISCARQRALWIPKSGGRKKIRKLLAVVNILTQSA